jgi:uncharacterized cupin superfamily protein
VSKNNNIWQDDWDDVADLPWFRGAVRDLPGAERLKASVYELPPGGFTAYHFHHGNEELLLVLRGRPTLRTQTGDRQLTEGEVVPFRVGPEGAHQLRNETDEPVRYVMMSLRTSPDVVEYPDTHQLSVMALTDSQFGEPLWSMRTLDPPGTHGHGV